MTDYEEVLFTCGYCGHRTKFTVVGSYTIPENDEKGEDEERWEMLKCYNCEKISFGNVELIESYDYEIREYDWMEEFVCKFPSAKFMSNQGIPEDVYRSYKTALDVKHIDNATCIASLRRTLEIICKENSTLAKGASLSQMINHLVKSGFFPPVLGSVSNVIRLFGNEGAHEHTKRVSDEQVEIVINFIESILEYVYVFPYKIKQLNMNIVKVDFKKD